MSVAVGVGDRIRQYDAVGPFIERFSNVSEPFLSSSVPNVQSDGFGIVLYSLDFKIYSDSTQIIGLKTVFAVPHK